MCPSDREFTGGIMSDAENEVPEYRFNVDVPLFRSVDYSKENPWLFIENDRVKVGLNLEYGGACCWISDIGSTFNLVNWFDPGRQIQTSYFAQDGYPQEVRGGPGPEGSEAFTFRVWNWNPVQAGDARDGRSPILGYRKEPGHLWTRCQPLSWGGMASALSLRGKWDPRSCPAEMFMDVDVTVDGPVVKLTFGFTYWGKESHGICTFEMPAVYAVAPLDRFWTYTGAKPWTGCPPEEHTEKIPYDMTREQYSVKATEHWGAWLAPDRTGLVFFQPDTQDYRAGTYYPNEAPDLSGFSRDEHWGRVDECHYWSGWRQVPIDPMHSRGEWDLYVIVGSLSEARQIIHDTLRNAPRMRFVGPIEKP
jgi:hypothetical protein